MSLLPTLCLLAMLCVSCGPEPRDEGRGAAVVCVGSGSAKTCHKSADGPPMIVSGGRDVKAQGGHDSGN